MVQLALLPALLAVERLVITAMEVGTAEAHQTVSLTRVAVVVDPLTTRLAGHASAFEARKLAPGQRHPNPLFAEKKLVRHLPVRQHLLRILLQMRVKLRCFSLGRFKRADPHGLVDVRFKGALQIDKGGCHLPPVTKFESAFPETATRDNADCVRRAAINLNKRHEAFTVFATRFLDAELMAGEHGHANPKDLARAEMTVGDLRLLQQIIEVK